MLYVYGTKEGKFVKVTKKTLKIRLIGEIENASYWEDKESAKSWLGHIKRKFPDIELKEAVLKLKE